VDEDNNALRLRIRELEAERTVLKSENALLRSKLGPAAWRIDGSRAERFIHELIGGNRTIGSADKDLISASGIAFEIKFSNLNEAVPGRITRRWNWAHILGSNRAKTFDRLLLLGPQDPQYRRDYNDSESPFVIFDIPFDEVDQLLESDNSIRINTNPTRFRRNTHRLLILHYQVTRAQLVDRYRTHSSAPKSSRPPSRPRPIHRNRD
jgi:hypothetical protein